MENYETPFAVNVTEVTDQMNKKVVTRLMRRLIVMNVVMTAVGIAAAALVILLSFLSKTSLLSPTNLIQLIISLILAAIGVFGIVNTFVQIDRSVKNASQETLQRKTLFYEDRFVVEAGPDETVVTKDRFIKMTSMKGLYLLFFAGGNKRSEVYFLDTEGFETEEQKESFIEAYEKKKEKKRKPAS